MANVIDKVAGLVVGPQGPQGPQGPKGDTGQTGPQGATGATGATPNLTMGTVTTLEPDSQATATITGTAENPVLNLGLPKGRTGEVSQAEFDEVAGDVDQLKEDLSDLQSDGVVPSAEQILTDKGVTDSVPYHFRKTGGDGADRLYDQIVGGTVCWNQLINDTSTFEVAGGENKTWTSTNQFTVDASHKYLALLMQSSALTSAVRNRFGININASYTYQSTDSLSAGQKAWAFAPSAAGNASLVFWCHTPSENVSFTDFMLHDLTAMFGSTVADYIYNLEQATAGAGVAFFKALFPNDYYPYNTGELVSVSGLSEHKMVGFNQWDEEWENGRINKTTGETGVGNGIRSKNFIHVMPNTEYCFRKIYANYSGASSVVYAYYDKNKTFISGGETSTFIIFTTPSGAAYMKFAIPTSTAVVAYANDICINLSDPAKNDTYKPYESHSYPLDSTLTLRGIPKLVDGKVCFDGDTYDADGTVTRRYGVVDLGTLTWNYDGGYFESASLNSDIKRVSSATVVPNACCSKYPLSYWNDSSDKVVIFATTAIESSVQTIWIKDTSYSDVATFKAAMSGVMLVYELATPTTEEADPYQHLQQCDPSGTEEYVSTGIVPIGHNSFYPENLRAKVEQLPWNFANLIAPTESTFTATRNYTTGALFIVSNVLYKATSNIANGGTITPNTNCTATTLAEIISALA